MRWAGAGGEVSKVLFWYEYDFFLIGRKDGLMTGLIQQRHCAETERLAAGRLPGGSSGNSTV